MKYKNFKKVIFGILILFVLLIIGINYLEKNSGNKNTAEQNFIQENNKIDGENIIVDKEKIKYFKVQDSFDTKETISVADLVTQKASGVKLKNFNEWLHTNFNYLEIYIQPVEYVGEYQLPLDFVNGYLESNKKVNLSNQRIEINHDSVYITPINAIQIDYNAYKDLNLQIEDGEGLNENHFKYSEVLPILLGSNYKEIYKKGENLEFYYLGKKVHACVLGFLEEGQNYNKLLLENNGIIDFNNYIVMPIGTETIHDMDFLYAHEDFIEDNINCSDFYLNILYTQKNNGVIKISNNVSYQKINEMVETKAKELGLSYSVVSF